MNTQESDKRTLNRFTSLPILMDMLLNRHLVLINPNAWEDKNDAFGIELYRKKKKLTSVLGACLSNEAETFHHWKIFADGMNGVRIEFDRKLLIKNFTNIDNIRYRNVKYLSFNEVEETPIEIDDLPFVKREPYLYEREFRIIYESKKKLSTASISIDISCIKKISINPWAPKKISESIKTMIKKIDGCEDLTISQSSIINSVRWKSGLEKSISTVHKMRNSG